MVFLTHQAATAIRTLTDRPEIPPGAGLRITSEGAPDERLALRVQPTPSANDTVVESEGVRLFLDQAAAKALDQMALDAGNDANGNLTFTVHDVPPTAAP